MGLFSCMCVPCSDSYSQEYTFISPSLNAGSLRWGSVSLAVTIAARAGITYTVLFLQFDVARV